MRRALALGSLAVALLVPLTGSAHAADGYTGKQLKQALVTKKPGYKRLKTQIGRVSDFRAMPRDFTFSGMPARCIPAASAGMLGDPAVVRRLAKAPVALSSLEGSHYLHEVLISADTGPVSVHVPKSCRDFKTAYRGKRIRVRVSEVPAADLPNIPGATVVAVKTKLPRGVWGVNTSGEIMVTVLQSGSLIMQTYVDTFGHVAEGARAFNEEAWAKATDKLGHSG